MVYNPSLGNIFNSKRNEVSLNSNTAIYARVVEVLLDESIPSKELYEELGREDSLNGIFYRDIFEPILEDESQDSNLSNLPFAYCDNPTLKRIPLKGEIVEITFKPGPTLGEGKYPFVAYYSFPINIWNNAHHNALPDSKASITEIDFGSNVEEQQKISSLQSFTGDVLLEGRLGQSLRFSGFNHPRSVLTTDSNISSPYAILKVGQDPEYDDLQTYVEDINKDLNSIYITTNHIVPIEKSISKQNTFRGTPPLDLDKFQNNQIILDSGRIVLHAKQDSIFLNSLNSISFESTTINLDSTQYLSIDAPEVYIGSNAIEPAVLGDSTEALLRKVLDLLTEIGTQFTKATTPASAVAVLAGLGAYIPAQANTIASRLSSIKSKKVKVE